MAPQGLPPGKGAGDRAGGEPCPYVGELRLDLLLVVRNGLHHLLELGEHCLRRLAWVDLHLLVLGLSLHLQEVALDRLHDAAVGDRVQLALDVVRRPREGGDAKPAGRAGGDEPRVVGLDEEDL